MTSKYHKWTIERYTHSGGGLSLTDR